MFTLPELPYDYAALEPHVDVQTMQIHHDKHHAAYVEKLNAALAQHPELLEMNVESLLRDIETLPADIKTAVRNHGGGHANHSLFWLIMSPEGGDSTLSGSTLASIQETFGSLEELKATFKDTALSLFGSGWTWLVKTPEGLKIVTTANQDSPLMQGATPILGLDVWEHAYYLKHQNKRADYIDSWWNVVNWSYVEKLYSA